MVYRIFFSIIIIFLFGRMEAQDTLRLCALPIHANDKVELQIKATNFINISSFQFSVAWEKNQFSFDSIGNFNPILTESNMVAYNANLPNVPDDIDLVRTLWFDGGGLSLDLEDESVLYSVYLSNEFPGQNGYYGIVDDINFPIEATDGDVNEIPIAINESGCFSLRFSDLTSSLEQVKRDSQFTILGNPTEGIFQVKSDFSEISTIQIISMDGRLSRQFQFLNTVHQHFDISDLADGVYYVLGMSTTRGIMGMQKVVLQR